MTAPGWPPPDRPGPYGPPQQPPGAQGYPPQSGPVPYGQPISPSYGSPTIVPGYGQVPPGQAGFLLPPPPPKKMSRGLLVALIAIPVVLLLGIGITIGTIGFRSSQQLDKAASETLSTPEQAGGLKQVHSAEIQTQLDKITSTLSGSDIEHPVAAAYGDASTGDTEIVVWGGTSRIGDLSASADRFFSSADKSFALIGSSVSSDPGRFGGLLQCRSILDPSGGKALCVALDHGVVLAGLITNFATQQDPASLLRSIREDAEHA